ncbi:MAG TPA: chalcone isomerase family protein [Spirochaetota bacterium]|nr:chalcone isomerase family protein [Spirochaetota bacterium]HPI89591.1 chalcone isomerase family protein [Spirochaetota bacterium]HPR48050.1 chalcone isomerase family protein [Spirochaetota bacterium]
MVKKFFLAVAALALICTPGTAKQVAGVDMPDSYSAGQDKLVLNGAAMREKYAIGVDVYVGGLYLKAKSSNALQIVNADEPMMIRLHLVRSVNSKDFSDNTLTGFEESCKNLGIDQKSIDKDINIFLEIFKDGIKKNDIFDIVYTKANGIQVFKNKSQTPKVTIKNMTLKKALFGIWLTKRTEDKLNILAQGMLGL